VLAGSVDEMLRRESWTRPVLFGLVSGVVIGAVMTAVLAITLDHAKSTPPVAPAQQFLDAWSRYRAGTWAVEGHFDRFVNGQDAVLSDDTFNVQRAPDHLSRQGHRVNAVLGGQRVVCVPDLEGVARCVTSPVPQTYDQEVIGELDGWRKIVMGNAPVFAVHVNKQCFELTRLRDDVAFDRYGRSSTTCFDPATGALQHSETRHPNALDVYDARVIRAAVTPDDFALPAAG
jgi:hypothetical protein